MLQSERSVQDQHVSVGVGVKVPRLFLGPFRCQCQRLCEL